MSLKIFHILFIILSALLCGGVSWWIFHNNVGVVAGTMFAVAAALLPIYGAWFLRKSKHLIL